MRRRRHSSRRRAPHLALVSSMAILLTACANSTTPVIERPNLPAAPAEFGKPVDLPAATKGASLKVFALENRAAAAQANRRLEADAVFYESVRKEFGAKE